VCSAGEQLSLQWQLWISDAVCAEQVLAVHLLPLPAAGAAACSSTCSSPNSHTAIVLLLLPCAQVGELMAHPDWYNAGYIFPAGFKSRLLFRSSVDLDALTLHECEIVGQGGACWPAPTFVVTARDREDEPIVAKSCTGCWSGVSEQCKWGGRRSVRGEQQGGLGDVRRQLRRARVVCLHCPAPVGNALLVTVPQLTALCCV
jgi:hypothetical protein